MQTVFNSLGQFRTLTRTRNINPFSLSGKQMPLFVLPASCWGFEGEKSCSSPNSGEARGRERLHGVDHDRLELCQNTLWGMRLQESCCGLTVKDSPGRAGARPRSQSREHLISI